MKWFSDPEDTNPSFIRLVRNILLFTIAANFGILVVISGAVFNIPRNAATFTALSITGVLEIISLILVLRGRVQMAKLVVPLALIIAATYSAVSANGLHDISMLGFPLIVTLGALLLRNKSLPVITPLVVIAIIIVGYADIAGINRSDMASRTDVGDIIIASIMMSALAALLQLLINRLSESIEEARRNEQAQIEANQRLIELQNSQEKRIIERTVQLSKLNEAGLRRNEQFRTIAQVARLIASIRDLNELLPTITRVISERFEYYHIGIFLLDEEKQYAVLSAANSEGGQRMLKRGHRLRVGETGLVGYAASKGIARIALDTGTDAVYFNNPDLPETRSEIALPLQISNEIIGVLDVQSTESNAFIQEDIDTLSTLADQVTIAIRNAQLFRDTQAAIAESQMLYGTVVREAWKTNILTSPQIGYKFTGTTPIALEAPITSSEVLAALESGTIAETQAKEDGEGKSIAVPLKLRGETIGVVNIKMPPETDLGSEETEIVSAAAERIALALENSSLLEDSQRRAARERTISEMSAKIGAGTEVESILKTAIRELGAQIGGAQISVEIGSDNE